MNKRGDRSRALRLGPLIELLWSAWILIVVAVYFYHRIAPALTALQQVVERILWSS